MASKEEIKVSVICLVYNHEKYLRDCLDGIVKQETNFRFEAVIHDDASTDGSKKIIEEYAVKYPDIIKPIYEKENIYSRKPYMFPLVAKHCEGKYLAICEGDDYWTDETKLQRQFDYMEKNPDCALCFHDATYLDMATGKKVVHSNIFAEKATSDGKYDAGTILSCEYLTGNAVPTASLFFRSKDMENLPEFYYSAPCEDFPLKLILASKGYVYYMPRVMSVYRTNVSNSATYKWRNQSKEKEIARYNSVIRTLDAFDAYSDGKYAKDLSIMKDRRMNTILILKGRAREVLKDKEKLRVYKLTDGRRDRFCFKLRMKAYLPFMYTFLRNIKHVLKK